MPSLLPPTLPPLLWCCPAASQSCLIDFRNIVRLDQSLPAAMVVRIQGNTTFEAVRIAHNPFQQQMGNLTGGNQSGRSVCYHKHLKLLLMGCSAWVSCMHAVQDACNLECAPRLP